MCSHLFVQLTQTDCSGTTQPSADILLETYPKPVSQTFHLPMDYLEETDRHILSSEVNADLELLQNNTSLSNEEENVKPLYHYLFEPKGHFSQDMLPKLTQTFTSNRVFLKETQQVVLARGDAAVDAGFTEDEQQDVVDVWNDLVYNPEFLEKYGYIEWSSLKHLNQSSTFLQSLSLINGVVPMFNLAMSVLLAILPFFILSYNRQCITLASYTDCLQQIGGNNQMFCKMISILDPANFNPQNMVVFILMLGLYSYQIYQNIVHTERFFQHVREVSENLYTTKQFLEKSQQRLHIFLEQRPVVNEGSPAYTIFYENVENHLHKTERLLKILAAVQPPHEMTLYRRFSSMGEQFRLYYHLYDDVEAKEVLLFLMNMNGYLDLMDAAARHLRDGNVHLARFDAPPEEAVDETAAEENLKEEDAPPVAEREPPKKQPVANRIRGMYYPRLVVEPKDNIVKNDVSLEQHPVLTGPNASGKTTFLKSVAINTLLSQQVGLGFYDEYHLIEPYQHIHSYLNIPDTSERDSLFEAETRRCKTILEKIAGGSAEDKHLCIFDELFSGTNPVDASRSAFSFLKYLCQHHPRVDFVLTTHYIDVCHQIEDLTATEGRKMVNYKVEDLTATEGRKMVNYKVEDLTATEGRKMVNYKVEDLTATEGRKMVNYKMEVLENPETRVLTMTYRMVPGISDIKGASHILENMGFPTDIVREVRGQEKA